MDLIDLDKAPDAINSIIKTINPVHPASSKQNKNFNKYFLSLNLDVLNFVKTLNRLQKKKLSSSKLYELLFKKIETNKYVYEKDIQKTFNKLYKMTDNKYLPKDLVDKFKFKSFYVDEDKKNKKETKKILHKNQNLKYAKNKIKINDNFYYEITLDPGRYDPKYNLIFKKTPNVYFKKEKLQRNETITKEKSSIKEINNSKEKGNKLFLKESNKSKFISLNDIHRLKQFPNKRFISSNYSSYYKEKEKKIFSSSMINFKSNNIFSPNFKKDNLQLLNKTQYSHFFDYLSNSNAKSKLKLYSANYENPNYYYDLSNQNEIEDKNNLKRSESCKNHMRIISFDKMIGREKKKKKDLRAEYRSSKYDMNYDMVSPKLIRLRKKFERFQNYKKFAVNKIIRHYNCFSPSDYFIFDINKKNRSIDNKDYISKVNIKYNL